MAFTFVDKVLTRCVTPSMIILEYFMIKVFNSGVPDKRHPNKKFVGSWVPMGLAAGVETWLKRHPQKDRTEFIITAALKLLEADGIIVELPPETAKGRPRQELPKEAYDYVRETSTPYVIKKKK